MRQAIVAIRSRSATVTLLGAFYVPRILVVLAAPCAEVFACSVRAAHSRSIQVSLYRDRAPKPLHFDKLGPFILPSPCRVPNFLKTLIVCLGKFEHGLAVVGIVGKGKSRQQK